MGRCVKKVSTWQGVTRTTFYVYDGWNLVAELSVIGTILREYLYGVDPSGGAGAGALLSPVSLAAITSAPLSIESHKLMGCLRMRGSGLILFATLE